MYYVELKISPALKKKHISKFTTNLWYTIRIYPRTGAHLVQWWWCWIADYADDAEGLIMLMMLIMLMVLIMLIMLRCWWCWLCWWWWLCWWCWWWSWWHPGWAGCGGEGKEAKVAPRSPLLLGGGRIVSIGGDFHHQYNQALTGLKYANIPFGAKKSGLGQG